MNRLWHITAYEYRRNVFKKSFIFVLISVPLMIAFNIGLGFFLESLKDNPLPVGFIDDAGIFPQQAIPAPVANPSEAIGFVRYSTEKEALAALKNNNIQAYYWFPADYFDTRRIELVYAKEPGTNAQRQFFDFLQTNLLTNYPGEIARRAAGGTTVTTRSLNGERLIFSSGPTFGNLMPLLIAFAFLGMLLISSGYLMSAMSEEKENRTIEIVVTSTSPMQLISGKVLGTVAISFTLLLAWSLVVIVGISISRQIGISWFENLNMDWNSVLATVTIAIPSFVLVAALMLMIGSMVTTTQEGQSLSTIFIILHMIPLYVAVAFLESPHGLLAIILSLLPFTSLATIAMRNLFSVVPAWQVLASMGVQTACAIGAMWLASRAFRLGMLKYGQRLTWSGLLQVRAR